MVAASHSTAIGGRARLPVAAKRAVCGFGHSTCGAGHDTECCIELGQRDLEVRADVGLRGEGCSSLRSQRLRRFAFTLRQRAAARLSSQPRQVWGMFMLGRADLGD
jgi:hypothetical protein